MLINKGPTASQLPKHIQPADKTVPRVESRTNKHEYSYIYDHKMRSFDSKLARRARGCVTEVSLTTKLGVYTSIHSIPTLCGRLTFDIDI